MHTTYRFDEIKQRGTKKVKCAKCGKSLNRSKTFYQTLNPFNRLADGTVKTVHDISIELQQEMAEWQKEPETCSNCLS